MPSGSAITTRMKSAPRPMPTRLDAKTSKWETSSLVLPTPQPSSQSRVLRYSCKQD